MAIQRQTRGRRCGALALSLLLAGCVNRGPAPEVPGSAVPTDRQMIPVKGIEGICFLRTNRTAAILLDQKATATGVLFDGRFLLTAGHTLMNASYPWGRIESIEITVGEREIAESRPEVVLRGGAVEVGSIPPDGKWTVSPSFQWRPRTWRDPAGSSTMIQQDYGFIDARRDLGRSAFELGLPEGTALRVGEVVKVAGYPGDRKRIAGASGTRLFQGEGWVTAVGRNLFSYNVVTARGLSGAPVWVERKGRKYVVGVHSGSDFAGQKGAVARIVDDRLLRDWWDWRARRARKTSR